MYLLKKGDVFMALKNRKSYDREFKQQTVSLADNTKRPDRDIEKEMGLYQGAIGHWRKELKADPTHPFPGTGCLKPEDEEIRQLRRELDIDRQERGILTKAVAIFSHSPKNDTRS
jgi:transposase